MPKHPVRDRAYFQARLIEEMERGWRYGRSFTLLIFRPAIPSELWRIERLHRGLDLVGPLVRASDIMATIDEQSFVVMLVESDAPHAQVALDRIDEAIASDPSEPPWNVTEYVYPADSPAIEALPFFVAA